MMRLAFALLSIALLAAPLAAEAQQAGKVYSIGILGDKALDANETRLWQTIRAGLREHGWNEGVNIRFEYRWVEGNTARLPELAADLVRLKPDLITTRVSLPFNHPGCSWRDRGWLAIGRTAPRTPTTARAIRVPCPCWGSTRPAGGEEKP